MTIGEVISVLISLLGLLIMGIALFGKMRKDRTALEVKLGVTGNKIDSLEKLFALEIAHRNEMSKVVQKGVESSMVSLNARIADNADLQKENVEQNRGEHLTILIKLDDLKDFFIKQDRNKKG